MVNKEHNSQGLKMTLEQSYPLGIVKASSAAPNAGQNKGYRIETTKGVYFVREYRRNISLSTATLEAPLLEVLAERRLPVPHIVRNTNGDFVSKSPQDTLFIVESFIDSDFQPSEGIELNDAQRVSAARTLADYHKNVQDDPPTVDTPADIKDYTTDNFFSTNKAISIWETAINAIQEKNSVDEIDLNVMNVGPQKLALLRDIDETQLNNQMRTMPSVLAHGDYTPQNLLYQGDEVAGIVDWELARRQPRVWELTRAVCSFCKQDGTEFFNTPVDTANARGFISAYEEINPLTDAEKDVMFQLATVASLFPYYLLSSRYIHGKDRADRLFPADSASWNWWANNADAMKKEIFPA